MKRPFHILLAIGVIALLWDVKGRAEDTTFFETTIRPLLVQRCLGLKARGMLKDRLVVWAGEFGRTPYAQSGDGRDHNHRGYSLWMAGGGVKGGLTYGATDEIGHKAKRDP
ncbi:MAG: hypothetical protein JWO08_1028, partial [Verrucomicrobiaceae bacterium]|nr:hypothetical protein [Verrucomicrobiaceae bacterium]